MKYNFFISTKRSNAFGDAPVWVKIYLDNPIPYERSTSLFITPKWWNNSFKRLEPASPNHAEINLKLNEKQTILDKYVKLYEDGHYVTIEDIENELKGKKARPTMMRKSIVELLEFYINDRKEKASKKEIKLAEGTLDNDDNKFDNIKEFLASIKRPNLSIQEFTLEMAEKAREYFKLKAFGVEHIRKHLQMIKTVMGIAFHKYKIPTTDFLLMTFMRAKKTKKLYLTPNEVAAIANHNWFSSLHQKTADLFLLQCYTGMSYSDVIRLNDEFFVEFSGKLFISYARKKNEVNGLLPVLPGVKEILARYGGKAPVLFNGVYNRILKEIAAICGIKTHLTSHVGRKTFGCMCIANGASMETTTKMLAKTNIQETADIYADINWQRIHMEVPHLFAKTR